ncbi:MAG: efflux RND transporter permease subunit [Candidatus Velamenicoccus archaeovorus]
MRWIVGTGLRARGAVVVLAALVLGGGVWQLRSAQVDSLPEFAPTTVEIQTEALGLSAEEVEQLITVPLEQDLLAGLPWLDTMRSASIPGLSSVELVFEPGTDLFAARQMVQERLTQAAGLPNVSGPPQMLEPLSSTRRILIVRLSSTTVSPIQMSVLARWTIRPRLLGVPGVSNVSIWGQRERQLQVQVDPERLRRDGLSLDQVIETTGNALWASPLTFLEASTPGTGGFIDTNNQRLGIQHLQPISTAAELAEVPIEGAEGTLRLGDIADVVEDHQPLIGDTVFADGRPGLLLAIDKFPGTSTLEVTRGVEEALDALRPGLPGIDVDPTVYRPATYIERGAGNLAVALLIGLGLLILVLGALRYEWRSAVIALTAMLTSLSVAWLVLHLRGTALNTMVLVGWIMALAVVTDDAVGDVDRLVQRLRGQKMNGVEPPWAKIVLETTIEMRTPATYATLIVLLALVPMFFVQGAAQPFIPTILLSFGLAVVASMLVALIVTPALGLLLLRGRPLERHDPPIARWLQHAYELLITRWIRSPVPAFAVLGVVLVAGLVAVPFLRATPLPSFRDGNVVIDLRAAPGTSLPEMDRITARMVDELSSTPGVLHVQADVGRAITSDRIVGVNVAQLWVAIDPSADDDATLSSIRGTVDGYVGIDRAVRTYSDERIGNVLSGNEHPIVVRLYGPTLETLQSQAGRMLQTLRGIEGVVRPRIELQPVEPTVNVTVDLAAAERLGIVPGDVRREAAALLSGIGVGSLFEQQKVFDVVVWGTPETRMSLGSVRDLLIDTRTGGHVRLGKVAEVTIEPTPTVIRHQGNSRMLDITADVQGRDVDAVAADVREALRTTAFPLEYHAELVGDVAQRETAHLRAIAVAVAAVVGIVLLLQACFAGWRLAGVVSLALPAAGAGGVLAAVAAGRSLSIGPVMGLFVVFAIAVRTTVASVRRFQQVERDRGERLGADVVVRLARERLVPIVTSAAATAAILLPFAISGGVAGQEVVHPMALVILGGLVTSVLVTVFVVPSLYHRFGFSPAGERASDQIVTVPDIEPVPGA